MIGHNIKQIYCQAILVEQHNERGHSSLNYFVNCQAISWARRFFQIASFAHDIYIFSLKIASNVTRVVD